MQTPFGNIMEETDRKWIVKTSGRLLGPFTFEEVKEEIRLKRFSIIDEIRSPSTRWGFIREHIDFREMVKQIREAQDFSRDDTMATTTMALDTKSEHRSDTKTPVDPYSEDTKTPPPVSAPKAIPIVLPTSTSIPSSPAETARDVTFSPTKKSGPLSSALANKTKTFGVPNPPTTQKSSNMGVVSIVVLALAVVGFIVFQKKFSKTGSSKNSVTMAQNYFAKGFYDKAYGIYRSAGDTSNLSIQDQFRYAVTLLYVQGQNAQARRQLESLKGNKELNNDSELENLIGLTFAKEGQWTEAKNKFSQAVKIDGNNKLAKINSTFATYNSGNETAALTEVDRLENEGISENFLSLFKAILVGKKYELNARYTQKTLEELGRWQGRTRWYRPEMTFMQAYLLYKNNRLVESKSFVEQLLNDDPDVTSQFLVDYGLDFQSFNWENYRSMCEDLAKGFHGTALSEGINSYCHYQRKEMSSSFDVIEKARNQFSKEKSIIPWHIFLLSKSDRTEEAKALIKIADSNNSPLVALVEAKICEADQDWECTEKAWKKLLAKDPTSPQAMVGLANKFLQQKDVNTANSYLAKTQIVANRYKPLAEIKEKINVEP